MNFRQAEIWQKIRISDILMNWIRCNCDVSVSLEAEVPCFCELKFLGESGGPSGSMILWIDLVCAAYICRGKLDLSLLKHIQELISTEEWWFYVQQSYVKSLLRCGHIFWHLIMITSIKTLASVRWLSTPTGRPPHKPFSLPSIEITDTPISRQTHFRATVGWTFTTVSWSNLQASHLPSIRTMHHGLQAKPEPQNIPRL